MHIAYYITGHGYGHAIRSSMIASALPLSVHLTLKTTVPYSFFQEELQRPFDYLHTLFDCGCVQIDGVSVDISATLREYRIIAEKNRRSLDDEVRWCRRNGVDGIVSDITPFAFEVARNAGIPSIAVTNFTWYDIYREYDAAYPDFRPYLDEIIRQYGSASLLLSLFPSMPLDYFNERQSVSLVGRRGTARREGICKRFGLNTEKKIALIYTGDFGLSSAHWKRLSSYTEWEFFSLHNIPCQSANFHIIDKKALSYPDFIASADCVISKLGYGVVAECMINGTPVVFLPRRNFAEYPVLEKAVAEWGGGIQLSVERFLRLDWDVALHKASDLKPLRSIPGNGALECADTIVKTISALFQKQSSPGIPNPE